MHLPWQVGRRHGIPQVGELLGHVMLTGRGARGELLAPASFCIQAPSDLGSQVQVGWASFRPQPRSTQVEHGSVGRLIQHSALVSTTCMLAGWIIYALISVAEAWMARFARTARS